MENAIIIVAVLVILCLSGFYVYRARKNGNTCIGCPHSHACSSAKKGGCSGGCSEEK